MKHIVSIEYMVDIVPRFDAGGENGLSGIELFLLHLVSNITGPTDTIRVFNATYPSRNYISTICYPFLDVVSTCIEGQLIYTVASDSKILPKLYLFLACVGLGAILTLMRSFIKTGLGPVQTGPDYAS